MHTISCISALECASFPFVWKAYSIQALRALTCEAGTDSGPEPAPLSAVVHFITPIAPDSGYFASGPVSLAAGSAFQDRKTEFCTLPGHTSEANPTIFHCASRVPSVRFIARLCTPSFKAAVLYEQHPQRPSCNSALDYAHLNVARVEEVSQLLPYSSTFILIPLFSALIFWASNGRFYIRYIDALFVCISAATGTGLSTIDLSSLTAWQQTIIVLLEIAGNQASCPRHPRDHLLTPCGIVRCLFLGSSCSSEGASLCVTWLQTLMPAHRRYFRAHLGHVISAEIERTITRKETWRSTASLRETGGRPAGAQRLRSDPNLDEYRVERKRAGANIPKPIRTDMVRRRMDVAPRLVNPMGVPARSATLDAQDSPHSAYTSARPTSVQIPDSPLHRSDPSKDHQRPQAEVGFGGFPGPGDVISGVSSKLFPTLHENFQRTLTMPRTATLIPQDHEAPAADHLAGPARRVRYLSFIADVGKNSHFRHLTEDQMLELGGVEYRALNSLMWITPLYYFGLLAISIIIITPYMVLPKWKSIYLPPMQHRKISPVWFSVFQVIGAWANTGMSLVDQNMLPFRTAYLLIIVLIICVLAGNTAYPIFFRFFIWLIAKCFPIHSRTRESLQFLLDHPRRCFIALFPSHQTWLLFFVLLLMNSTLFAGDLILNIDNPATESIPIGTRIALAFLSAAAVRSAGFQGVAVSSLVPAVQVLYVIMMYIAIYPIAMSVRATNVYEEKSLGIFDSEEDLTEPEDDKSNPVERRVAIWGKYLMRHMRRQLSFDMWWLALSLLLICIIERDGLMNPQNATWFNVFAVIFELVSGYGTVGLSLGIPYANYSFSGAWHTMSKLIICAVMLRGRHRGLPDALDRAVLLPKEFAKHPSAVAHQDPPDSARLHMASAMPQLPERPEAPSSPLSGVATHAKGTGGSSTGKSE
ncbi:hypothetical protein NM688_g4595 [Phlebia brevispora]|uniref:Uncharacterized protein n=1 Tax=Phlebia brevispora TaxID=194682 RepID=A0ACC1T2F3_9APHY|nr:hypothetical protein NM688_g4595 [Phlebia brevispora]